MNLSWSTRTVLPAAALAAIVALAGCASPGTQGEPAGETSTVVVENAKPTLTLVTEDGEQSYQEDRSAARGSVEVPVSPSRVVTFDIATLDTLHTIGAGAAVAAIPDVALPEYLAEYADLPKVGTLFEPDFEAVAEIDPDLIVTAARSTGQYDALSEIATTIDLTGSYAGTFEPEAALVRARQLGTIFEREEAVDSAAAAIESLAEKVSTEVEGTALVLSVSGGEYGAFGEGSRFGYFFDGLGFTPAVPAAELPGAEGSPHGDTVTNEFILQSAPDWILAFDRGSATGDASTAAATLDNALVAQTPAAKAGHIVYLPASELYIVINGLTAVQNVLTAVDDAVQA